MNQSNEDVYNQLMTIFKWIPILFYLNFLWFVGTLAGLVALGVGPATVSLFETLKEIQWRNNEISIGKFFFNQYKKKWKETNKWIVVFYAVFLFLWIDYRLINLFNTNIIISRIVYPIFILLLLLVILTSLYFFAFYTNFELPLLKIIENSLLLVLSNPLRSFIMLLFLILYYNLILRWPIIFLFFLGSLPAFVVVLLLKNVYFKIIQASNKPD